MGGREGMGLEPGGWVKTKKNLSATELKDIASLRIHSISQLAPDGGLHGDAAPVSLPFRPHGLLVNLRIDQGRRKRRLNDLEPEGLKERHVLLWRERRAEGRAQVPQRAPERSDVHLLDVFVQVGFGAEEAPTLGARVLLLPVGLHLVFGDRHVTGERAVGALLLWRLQVTGI